MKISIKDIGISCREVFPLYDGSVEIFDSNEAYVKHYGYRIFSRKGDKYPLTPDMLRESIRRGRKTFYTYRKGMENMGFGESHEYKIWFNITITG